MVVLVIAKVSMYQISLFFFAMQENIYYISLLAFGFLAFLRDMNIDQNALNGQVSVNEIGSPVEV